MEDLDFVTRLETTLARVIADELGARVEET
jgi:hypothetical protein